MRHESDQEASDEAMQERLEDAARHLAETALQAMCQGREAMVRGTRSSKASDVIFEVQQSDAGNAVLEEALCYLAQSLDPVAQGHARKIAEIFANNYLGMCK